MSNQLYQFIYEFGKQKLDRAAFTNEVALFLEDYAVLDKKDLEKNYPAFKLGEEAREALEKVENLRPKKAIKTTKEKKGKK